MVAIDTDVLLLAFAFHRDPRQAANAEFLSVAQGDDPVTTIYSVMELLGKLSFNLPAGRLAQWPSWLQNRYGLSILYPGTTGLDAASFFQREFIDRPFGKMQRHQMPFLDSLILNLAEAAPEVKVFVTWNARHFRDKTSLTVLTPAAYLEKWKRTGFPCFPRPPMRLVQAFSPANRRACSYKPIPRWKPADCRASNSGRTAGVRPACFALNRTPIVPTTVRPMRRATSRAWRSSRPAKQPT